MRYSLVASLVLGLVASVEAQDRLPNQLTEEEMAEGWILLFDGKSASQWKIEGDHEILDGVLILGGKRETRAYFPIRVLRDFEVRFQYRMEGKANAGLGSRSHDQANRGVRGFSLPMLEPTNEWHDSLVKEYFDARHPFQRFITYHGGANGVFQPIESVWIEAPAGQRVFLRNVRLKHKRSGPWLWLVPTLFVMCAIAAVCVWRWKEKKQLPPIGKDQHGPTKQGN